MNSGDVIALVPAPAKLTVEEQSFVVARRVLIAAAEAARPAATHLARILGAPRGSSVETLVGEKEASAHRPEAGRSLVRMELCGASNRRLAEELGSEGYSLNITPGEIHLLAAARAGFLWGVETIRQLLPPAYETAPEGDAGAVARAADVDERQVALPCLAIIDRPRFAWRGLHLDVARHFFGVPFVEKLLDLMALFKLNHLHWHLTDDQGWRIEIKGHPELTAAGAWRSDGAGGRYGGYYTREEVARVVAYAEGRGITVLPEIEMPGHARAALAAFPELSCRGEPITISAQGGISKEVFCAGKEATFHLLEEVLDEVGDLFPSKLIHIGGDECPKDRWRECPECQARIRAEGLANEDELQSYFVRRIEAHLARRGKRLIGWDEILEGGLAPDATVMSWRGVEGGITAARAGHDVVMSPVTNCYFDYRQSTNPGELGPAHFRPPVTTLRKVYDFEPVPEVLSEAEALHVLGAQANLWTENVPTPERAEYMIFPRICALAEVVWSPRETRDWESFKRRLHSHASRLDRLRVNYCHIVESL